MKFLLGCIWYSTCRCHIMPIAVCSSATKLPNFKTAMTRECQTMGPRPDGFVDSLPASCGRSCDHAPYRSYLRPSKKVQTASLIGAQLSGYEFVKGRVVYRIVYGDKHNRHFIGSVARVGYCFPVPDFFLVLPLFLIELWVILCNFLADS